MRSRIYRDDLAFVHRAGFTRLALHASRHLRRLLARSGVRAGTIIDLGCGAGELARELTTAGFEVVGVDASGAMIRLARAAAPRAKFRRAAIDEFDLPRCDAVTAIGEPLCYVAHAARRAAHKRLFRRVARALRPGGWFVFDVLVDGAPMSYRTWKSGPGWLVLVSVSEDARRRRIAREITTFVRAGSHYRRRSETHVLRAFDASALARELEHAGFSVRTVRAFGGERLGPRRLGFIARKRRERESPSDRSGNAERRASARRSALVQRRKTFAAIASRAASKRARRSALTSRRKRSRRSPLTKRRKRSRS